MFRKILLFALLCVGAHTVASQNRTDSIQFCSPSNWEVLHQEPGLTVRSFHNQERFKRHFAGDDIPAYLHKLLPNSPLLRDTLHLSYLFDTIQNIYVMEIDPSQFIVMPAQQANKLQTSALCKSAGGVAAVNGGFFVVNPKPEKAAVANDFLKIDEIVRSPTPMPGWGNAAVALDNQGHLYFNSWPSVEATKAEAEQWSAPYPHAMVAGPMLILNEQTLSEWQTIDKHTLSRTDKANIYAPRTAIGHREDGTIVLLVVDGRGLFCFGASFPELAAMGRWLGLSDMLNLDGGGSSAMVCRSKLINVPSDGLGIIPVERSIANAMVVVPRKK